MTTEVPRTATRMFGVRLHEVSSADGLREVLEGFLDGPRLRKVYTPNPEIMLRAREDPEYAAVLDAADLAIPDGAGLALVMSLRLRRPVRRWPGVEVAATLLRIAADRGEPATFVGGRAGVAERAAARWRARLPSLAIDVVGAGDPYGADGRATVGDDEQVGRIRTTRPSVILVGLGSPTQERWIDAHADGLPSVRVAIGVGGAFDMWAGTLRRAPRVLRRLGLEWAWRLALEPRRLPRIARATLLFPVRALTDRT